MHQLEFGLVALLPCEVKHALLLPPQRNSGPTLGARTTRHLEESQHSLALVCIHGCPHSCHEPGFTLEEGAPLIAPTSTLGRRVSGGL